MPRKAKPLPLPLIDPASSPAPGVRAMLIRRTKLKYPKMSEAQLARYAGCSRSNVHQVLTTFLARRSETELRDFQANKADIYDAVQLRALESVTDAKLQEPSATSLVTAAAILEDKARLVRGQATNHQYHGVVGCSGAHPPAGAIAR